MPKFEYKVKHGYWRTFCAMAGENMHCHSYSLGLKFSLGMDVSLGGCPSYWEQDNVDRRPLFWQLPGWIYRVAMICFALAGGCTTVEYRDYDADIVREGIINRKYLLIADATFRKTKQHYFFAPYSAPMELIDFPQGTVVKVKHVEQYTTNDLMLFMTFVHEETQAVVQNGPNKGERIAVGWIYIKKDNVGRNSSDADDRDLVSSDTVLIPIPDKIPDWLNIEVYPFQVKPVPKDTLLRAMHDQDGLTRMYAAKELLRRNTSNVEATEVGITALGDKLYIVRAVAINEFSQRGVPSPAALAALVKRLADPSLSELELKQLSQVVLAAGPEGLKLVAELLKSNELNVIGRAADILVMGGAAVKPYLPNLLEAIYRDGKVITFLYPNYIAVLHAICNVDIQLGFKIALEATQDDFRPSRELASEAMENVGKWAAQQGDHKIPEAAKVVLTKMKEEDPSGSVREAAAQALIRLKYDTIPSSCPATKP